MPPERIIVSQLFFACSEAIRLTPSVNAKWNAKALSALFTKNEQDRTRHFLWEGKSVKILEFLPHFGTLIESERLEI